MPQLPMFPLGGVLFPSLVLPLHVFEPRYRALVRRCLEADEPEFGVVLIERGSEVGGGDVRSSVGTVARIVEGRELDDGRWALLTAGERRLRVLGWHPDDPFPLAEVQDWPDEDADAPSALTAPYEDVVAILRRVLGLAAEVGEAAAPATVELSEDPVLGSYQVAGVAPFGPADQQKLLAMPGAAERLHALAAMLEDEATYLTQRLQLG